MIGVVEKRQKPGMLPRQFYAYTLHVNLPEMGEILERELKAG